MTLLRKKKTSDLPYVGLITHFRDLLNEATFERPKRPDTVTLEDGTHEWGWVLYERTVMRDEVNRLRKEKGLDSVDESHFLRVETNACGHIDYVFKYAIGCADLVRGEEGWHA